MKLDKIMTENDCVCKVKGQLINYSNQIKCCQSQTSAIYGSLNVQQVEYQNHQNHLLSTRKIKAQGDKKKKMLPRKKRNPSFKINKSPRKMNAMTQFKKLV